MSDQKNNSSSQLKSSSEVDQAILQLRGLLTQPKDKVIIEMMTICYALQGSPGFPKLAEVFLIYMDRIKDLPPLEVGVVDQILNLLMTICEKRMTSQPAKAFNVLARLFINPEDAPGNRIVRERFKYSREAVKRIGIEEYLGHPMDGSSVVEFAVFLMENYREAVPAHISFDLEKIGIISQAEKRSLRNQMRLLTQQQIECNQRNIMLATELERLRTAVNRGRPADDSPTKSTTKDRPSTRQRLGSLPPRSFPNGGRLDSEGDEGRSTIMRTDDEKEKAAIAYKQFLEQAMRELMVRHDTLSERVTELDVKVAQGAEMLKTSLADKEAFKKDRDAFSRTNHVANRAALEKDIDALHEAFLGYKRDIDHRIGEYITQKRDLDLKQSEFTSYKKDIEARLTAFANYQGELEVKLTDSLKKNLMEEAGKIRATDAHNNKQEFRDLKEKLKALEVKVFEMKPSASSLLSSNMLMSQSPYAELNTRELAILKNQQETMLIALQKNSKELSDHVIYQTATIEDLKKKARILEEDGIVTDRKLIETRDLLSNLIKEYNQFRLNVGTMAKPSPEDSPLDYPDETKLSKLDELCRSHIEKQIYSSFIALERKLLSDIKKEVDLKSAEQLTLNEVLRSNLESQIKIYESNLMSLHEKIERPLGRGETNEEDKRKYMILWNAVSAISNYLGLKVNVNTGTVEKLYDGQNQTKR